MGLVSEFLNLSPPDSGGFYIQTKTASMRKTEELEKYCNEHDIEVPELKTFYFRRPSDFVEPYVLPADLVVISKLKEDEGESDGEDMD